MKLQAIAIMTFLTFMNVMAQETTKSTDMNTLELTQEWDKTFPHRTHENHVPQPLRHHACRRPL